MGKLIIVTDSSCDLSLEYLKTNNIKMLPLTVEILGTVYKDIIDINLDEFYKLIDNPKAVPKTAAVNTFAFQKCFEEELKKGNEILYIGLSSKLSSTFNCAAMAKEEIGSGKIHLFDSKSAAFGQGLLVKVAQSMIDSGKNIEEIIKVLEDIKPRMDYAVMINNIEILKRSGRISGIQAFAGNMLNIKPIISVDDGEVNVKKKIRGTKAGINYLVKRVEEIGIDSKYPVIICYGSDLDLRDMIYDKLAQVIDKDSIESMQIGATIGSHTGKSGVGIFFVRK